MVGALGGSWVCLGPLVPWECRVVWFGPVVWLLVRVVRGGS